MRAFKRSSVAILAGLSAAVQGQSPLPSPERLANDSVAQLATVRAQIDYHPDARGLSRIVRTLQGAPGVTAEAKATAAELSNEADAKQSSGQGAEARRLLSRAISVLQGVRWDARAEFAASLSLRTDLPVGDSSQVLYGELTQTFAAQYKPESSLQLKLTLNVVTRPSVGATAAPGKALLEIGSYDLPTRDLNDSPYFFAVGVGAVPDGTYAIVGEVSDGTVILGKAVANIVLIRDIEARRLATERALAGIKGHDDTKASIRFPFEMIRAGNSGRLRSLGYDYLEGVRRSTELLDALRAGKDLLLQAKGDLYRHYYFADAKEIMPYRLYVPSSWEVGKKLPLIVALRGSNDDPDTVLSGGDGVMRKFAEKLGYVVVAPLGYRVDGTFGVRFPVAVTLKETPMGLPEPSHTVRAMQLSEQDTLNVIARVSAEYHTDPSRVYITGNSQGGGGTWIMTARHPDAFAAAAPCASSNDLRGMPFEQFKSVPVLACVGERDVEERKIVQKFVVGKINAAGGSATYLEVPNGTHQTGVQIATPQIFAFFGNYQKKQ